MSEDMMQFDLEERRRQVLDQCRVVTHLATALARLFDATQMQAAYAEPGSNPILDMGGDRTARLMNMLGNALNGMDAVDAEDDWVNPIFEKQREMYPLQDPAHD